MIEARNRSHLDRLEAESIHILREVAAQFRNPVMLYSVGKDSSVLLHLLVKAFHPARPPIPLLHVDTGWKFREMIAFRDQRARETGVGCTRGRTRTAFRRASARSATAPPCTPT